MTSLETRLRRLALAFSLRAIRPDLAEEQKRFLDAAAAQLDRVAEQARALERPAVPHAVPPHWLPQQAPAQPGPGAVVVPFPRRSGAA